MAEDAIFRDGTGGNSTFRYVDVGNGVKALVALVGTAPYIVDKFTTLAVVNAVNLSTVSGGIPAASSSVFMYVPAGAGNILYTDDGTTTPTASVGILVPAGDIVEITVRPLTNIKLFSTSGTVTVSLSFRHFAAS